MVCVGLSSDCAGEEGSRRQKKITQRLRVRRRAPGSKSKIGLCGTAMGARPEL